MDLKETLSEILNSKDVNDVGLSFYTKEDFNDEEKAKILKAFKNTAGVNTLVWVKNESYNVGGKTGVVKTSMLTKSVINSLKGTVYLYSIEKPMPSSSMVVIKYDLGK